MNIFQMIRVRAAISGLLVLCGPLAHAAPIPAAPRSVVAFYSAHSGQVWGVLVLGAAPEADAIPLAASRCGCEMIALDETSVRKAGFSATFAAAPLRRVRVATWGPDATAYTAPARRFDRMVAAALAFGVSPITLLIEAPR